MPKRLDKWLKAQHPLLVSTVCLLLLPLLGVVDYASGPDLAFSVFYLVPLAVVAWRIGLSAAIPGCIVAAAAWGVADAASSNYSMPLIPVWNAATRLVVFLTVAALVSSLHKTALRAEELARLDALTSVANGRGFEELAVEAILRARSRREPLSVAYIDLDDFKSVNDRLGHSGGDRVLQAVATALKERTRSTDVVGRLGGDEFALLLPGTGTDATAQLMEDLMRRVTGSVQDFPIPVSFSAGAVTFLRPPASIDELVHESDGLMYAAKDAGKGTYRHVTIGAGDAAAAADRTPARLVRELKSSGSEATPELIGINAPTTSTAQPR